MLLRSRSNAVIVRAAHEVPLCHRWRPKAKKFYHRFLVVRTQPAIWQRILPGVRLRSRRSENPNAPNSSERPVARPPFHAANGANPSRIVQPSTGRNRNLARRHRINASDGQSVDGVIRLFSAPQRCTFSPAGTFDAQTVVTTTIVDCNREYLHVQSFGQEFPQNSALDSNRGSCGGKLRRIDKQGGVSSAELPRPAHTTPPEDTAFVGATVVLSPQGWQYNCHPNIHTATPTSATPPNSPETGRGGTLSAEAIDSRAETVR